MVNHTRETMKTNIKAIIAAFKKGAEVETIPLGLLEDEYKRNPEEACRKALRITRAIGSNYRRLRAIDRLLANHGIEFVRFRNGHHAFSYSNTGDSYAATVILFESGAFRVSSWGDVVERNSNRYA